MLNAKLRRCAYMLNNAQNMLSECIGFEMGQGQVRLPHHSQAIFTHVYVSRPSPFPSPFSPRPFSIPCRVQPYQFRRPEGLGVEEDEGRGREEEPTAHNPYANPPLESPASVDRIIMVRPFANGGRQRGKEERCAHTFKHVRNFWVWDEEGAERGEVCSDRPARPHPPVLSRRCGGSNYAVMCVKQSLVDDYMPKNEHGEPAKMSVYPGAGVMSEAGGAYPDGSR